MSKYSYEGHIGIGTDFHRDDSIITYGGYLKANYPNDDEDVIYYGLVGVGGVFHRSESLGNNSVASFSFGGGMELLADKTFSITLELLHVVDFKLNDNDYKLSSLGLGYTYYFHTDNSKFKKNRQRIKSIRPYGS